MIENTEEPPEGIYLASRLVEKAGAEISFTDLAKFRGEGRLEYEDPSADNGLRAEWAIVGLRAFAERMRLLDETPRLVIGDFLANLRHLCDALGIDFADVSASGEEHHYCEIRGE